MGAVKSLDQSPSTATLDKVRSTLKATEESVAEAADLIEAVARRMDAAYRKYGGPGSRAQFFELSRRLLDILALKLDRSYAKSAKRNLREGVRQTLQGMVDTLEAAVKKGEIGSVRTFASDILETFQQFNKEVDALDERIKEVHRLKSITFTGVRLLLIWLGVIAGLAVFVYMNYDRIAALTEFLLSIL